VKSAGVLVGRVRVHGHHDHGHGREAYHQVADEDLEDLGLEARSAAEHLLQEGDEDMANGSANKRAIDGHLGDSRGEIMALLAPVVGNPRCKKLLQA